jgi:hypothetical protein
MIYKSKNILYFFDLDGTIFGFSNNFLKSPLIYIKNGPNINPNKYDIRWNVICGRPTVDRPLIKLCFGVWGLRPKYLITYPSFIKRQRSIKSILDFKIEYMKLAIEGKYKNLYDGEVEKVFYIDANLDSVCYINNRRQRFPMMAITIKNFLDENFNMFL